MAQTPQYTGRHHEDAAKPLNGHDMIHPSHGEIDGRGIRRIQAREGIGPDGEGKRQQLREQKGLPQSDMEYPIAAILLPCAEVLTVKGHCRLGKGFTYIIGEVLEVQPRCGSRDGLCAEAVHAGLHKDIGYREHRILNTRRDAHLQNALQVPRVNTDIAELQLQRPLLMHQRPHHHRRRKQVGNGCCQRHPGNAEMEADHKDQIQHHIQPPGAQHIDKRAFCVADGAKNRRAEIVDHDEGHTQHIQAEVQHRHVQHLCRCADGLDQGPGNHKARQHHQKSAGNGRRHNGMNGRGYLLRSAAAQHGGHHHIGADGGTHDKIHKNAHIGHIGAHRRQRITAGKAAHHRHIRRIEQMLQYACGCQRQRKDHQLPEQSAVQHVHLIGICFHHTLSCFVSIPENSNPVVCCRQDDSTVHHRISDSSPSPDTYRGGSYGPRQPAPTSFPAFRNCSRDRWKCRRAEGTFPIPRYTSDPSAGSDPS